MRASKGRLERLDGTQLLLVEHVAATGIRAESPNVDRVHSVALHALRPGHTLHFHTEAEFNPSFDEDYRILLDARHVYISLTTTNDGHDHMAEVLEIKPVSDG
jgi:hypothetical protein